MAQNYLIVKIEYSIISNLWSKICFSFYVTVYSDFSVLITWSSLDFHSELCCSYNFTYLIWNNKIVLTHYQVARPRCLFYSLGEWSYIHMRYSISKTLTLFCFVFVICCLRKWFGSINRMPFKGDFFLRSLKINKPITINKMNLKLLEGERGEWKSGLKTQHSKN